MADFGCGNLDSPALWLRPLVFALLGSPKLLALGRREIGTRCGVPLPLLGGVLNGRVGLLALLCDLRDVVGEGDVFEVDVDFPEPLSCSCHDVCFRSCAGST